MNIVLKYLKWYWTRARRKVREGNLFATNAIYHKNTHGNWTLSHVVHERAINSEQWECYQKIGPSLPQRFTHIYHIPGRWYTGVVCVRARVYVKTFLCTRCKISRVYLYPTAVFFSFFFRCHLWPGNDFSKGIFII